MSPDYNHYRLVLRDFLSLDQCKELEFVHKSCCTVGYRPNVFSTTISHLIATNCAHLIMPFVPIRERLKEKLEEFFGCEYELFVEFTGLISWTRGACIGWHSDDNRPYLRQRHFAAVCYLNSYGMEFKGGLFHFQDGEPMTVVPRAGDVIMYTADSRNIHSVDEIIDGERITLTLWFSRDASHDEDAKLVGLLSHASLNYLDRVSKSYLLLPASSKMYWFPPDQAANHQLGFDIRFARIHALCYDLYFSEEGCYSKTNVLPDLSEFQMKPLFLVRENESFTIEFANIMHALQVLQFSHWKGPALVSCMSERETHKMVGGLSESQQVRVGVTRAVFMKDLHLEELIFNRSYDTFEQRSIDWRHVSAATAAWEDYSCKLLTELCMSLPYWRNHQSIFSVPFDSL